MATLRKDGRWMARRMIQGKSWTAYGQSKEEADTNLRSLLGDTLSTPTGSRLHDVAVRLWWPNLEYVSHASKTRYVGIYRQYIADSIGVMEIGEVNVSDCQAVIREAGRKLSPSSLSLIRSVMHQIFKAAQADGMIGKNPADFLKMPKAVGKRRRVLTVAEAQAFLDKIRGTKFDAPGFLAVVLGLRRGECLGLRWSDLDRQRGELTIARQRLERRYGKASKRKLEVEDGPLKTKSSQRVLHLTRELVDEIDKRGDLDSEWICTKGGKPWTPGDLSNEWMHVRADFGLPDWRFHDLRHGAAGLLYAAGCDPLLIAAVLGHSKPDMSMVYTDVSDARRKEAGTMLSNLLNMSKTVDNSLH